MKNIQIAWYGLHFGEEPAMSGLRGSGTIFFCHCNLKCVFCQNWQISQMCKRGKKYQVDQVAEIMLQLQRKGAHNINLVSPTVWSYWLKIIIPKARKRGLEIPIVWNSSGFEQKDVLMGFKGLVDIYLPDYKYDDENLSAKYSSAISYPKVAREAILEMQRQVEDLVLDNAGMAKKGLIVRHLVLPGHLENTKKCLEFIRSISPNIHLSLMSQYNPSNVASDFPEIDKVLTKEEYRKALKMVESLRFENGWIQDFGISVKCLNPDFTKENPFSNLVI